VHIKAASASVLTIPTTAHLVVANSGSTCAGAVQLDGTLTLGPGPGNSLYSGHFSFLAGASIAGTGRLDIVDYLCFKSGWLNQGYIWFADGVDATGDITMTLAGKTTFNSRNPWLLVAGATSVPHLQLIDGGTLAGGGTLTATKSLNVSRLTALGLAAALQLEGGGMAVRGATLALGAEATASCTGLEFNVNSGVLNQGVWSFEAGGLGRDEDVSVTGSTSTKILYDGLLKANVFTNAIGGTVRIEASTVVAFSGGPTLVNDGEILLVAPTSKLSLSSTTTTNNGKITNNGWLLVGNSGKMTIEAGGSLVCRAGSTLENTGSGSSGGIVVRGQLTLEKGANFTNKGTVEIVGVVDTVALDEDITQDDATSSLITKGGSVRVASGKKVDIEAGVFGGFGAVNGSVAVGGGSIEIGLAGSSTADLHVTGNYGQTEQSQFDFGIAAIGGASGSSSSSTTTSNAHLVVGGDVALTGDVPLNLLSSDGSFEAELRSAFNAGTNVSVTVMQYSGALTGAGKFVDDPVHSLPDFDPFLGNQSTSTYAGSGSSSSSPPPKERVAVSVKYVNRCVKRTEGAYVNKQKER
jgi:hypothetical protein